MLPDLGGCSLSPRDPVIVGIGLSDAPKAPHLDTVGHHVQSIQRAIADAGLELLRARFDVVEDAGSELASIIGDYDAIIVRSATRLDAALIDRADRLRVIGRAGVGVDNVDVEAATRRGIVVANAAESSLEHHLGMTCDPVAGFVQIPCIERCAFGAVKSWTGFMIASNEIPANRRVDFDTTVAAMALTAKEMNSKYKETSEGGLAVSLVLC